MGLEISMFDMNVGNKPTAILSQNSSEGIQSSPCGAPSILAFEAGQGVWLMELHLDPEVSLGLGVNGVRCGADTALYGSIYIGYWCNPYEIVVVFTHLQYKRIISPCLTKE